MTLDCIRVNQLTMFRQSREVEYAIECGLFVYNAHIE